MDRRLFESEHDEFRSSVRRWLDDAVVPNYATWETDGIIPREVFAEAGELGYLGMAVPEQYGGGGVDDFRFNLVLGEETQAAGVAGAGLGLTLHTDICLPYFLHSCTDEQAVRWLPGIASGALITAVAMTEPGTGSDLAAISTTASRDGDSYVVNGAKTFITNGINADLVIVAATTDRAARHAGVSLFVIERGMHGFERGRNLDKIGLHAQDTAELFFDNVAVPVENRLGAEGTGWTQLVTNLAQERLSIGAAGVAAARAAVGWTTDYVRGRTAFNQPIGAFQNTRFTLAECHVAVTTTQAFIDRCVEERNAGRLTPEDAAIAKLSGTEVQHRVVDACLQLHGGYGFMREQAIARAYADARVTTIYGGTSEIMKEIIGRSLDLVPR